jgi:cathepsin D
MGLAFGSLSVYRASPVFQTLVSERVLGTPMFGFKLVSSGSELFLGGVNPKYKEKDFTWVTLSHEVC